MKDVPEYWYDISKPVPSAQQFLAKVYRYIINKRKAFYDKHSGAVYRAPMTVIVVGNLTVGGTGKTPVVIELANFLKSKGFHPGIISRGYGGQSARYPMFVTSQSDPGIVGDEPLLIAKQTEMPLVVDPKRKRGIPYLINSDPTIDVILSDDGLQHYAMARDIEVLLIDGERRFGNQKLLPAGPLRESLERSKSVDFIINNGGEPKEDEFLMTVSLGDCSQLGSRNTATLSSFRGQKVHAVAGIGNPQRFFNALQKHDISIIAHTFADHHHYKPEDLQFNDDLPILMTEKDAVKCAKFILKNVWVVPMKIHLPEQFFTQFIEKLEDFKKDKEWTESYSTF